MGGATAILQRADELGGVEGDDNEVTCSYTLRMTEAWRTAVLNRWRKLCPSCFDQLAEQAGVRYSFTALEGMSRSDQPTPRSRSKRSR